MTDTDNIDKFIQETKPDVLIHSAAQRFPDQIQKNPESARKLNVDATMKMAASMSKFFLKENITRRELNFCKCDGKVTKLIWHILFLYLKKLFFPF